MDQNSFEHKIQKKFEGYQPNPPAHVWHNILSDLEQQRKDRTLAGKLQRNRTLIVTVAAGIAAAGLLLFYLFNNSNTSHKNNTFPENTRITEDSSDKKPSDPENHQNHITTDTKTVFDSKDSSNRTDSKPGGENSPVDTVKKKNERKEQNPGGLPLDRNTYLREKSGGLLTFLNPCSLQDIISPAQIPIHRRLSFPDDNRIAETQKKHISRKSSNLNRWSFGLYATPEMLMTKTPAAGTHSNYSADFAAIYSINEFFIQSGISYLSGNSDRNIEIDYLKYDFLGAYEDVYEVTFDSTENGVEPTYHTKTVEVYDTLQKQTSSRFENDYRYLNLPVLIGYGRQITPSLSLSVKSGPIISLMLKDSRKIGFNQPNTDITSMAAPEPMAKTNWQILFSAGIEYRVSSTIHFALEPRIKYYFDPVYNLDNTINRKKPYSIGVRTGVVVDF
ncbi:MAG: hypothetical protein K9J27_05190 [Bacteroidales bacterium]|nr:hypothetical protein [Bacteroidales bacterium]MCF8333093.1 hypothetical protein [Bacteroidales bacterium]